MHPLLRNTDDLTMLRSSVLSIEAVSSNKPFIEPYDIAFESFFSTVSNRFQLGGNNRTTWDTPKVSTDLVTTLTNLGYNKVRLFTTVVPPGFHGNMSKFLGVLERIVPALLTLPAELNTLRAVVASSLNGSELVFNQSGIAQLRSVHGIDPAVLIEYKSYFKPNVVTEQLFGTVYANIGEFQSKHQRLFKIAKDLSTVDFVQITKLADSFHTLIQDFHTATKQGHLNKPMSTTAIHELTKVTECLATAVTLSAIIQGTMTELSESGKLEIEHLTKTVSVVGA